jgi:hypothetical protein
MLMRSSKNVCLSIFSGKNIEFSEKCLFFCFLVEKYRIFGKHDRDRSLRGRTDTPSMPYLYGIWVGLAAVSDVMLSLVCHSRQKKMNES